MTIYAGKGIEPDIDGAQVGMFDLLQEGKKEGINIITNDRWIKSVDGTRVHAHRDHQMDPHTVIEIMDYKEGGE